MKAFRCAPLRHSRRGRRLSLAPGGDQLVQLASPNLRPSLSRGPSLNSRHSPILRRPHLPRCLRCYSSRPSPSRSPPARDRLNNARAPQTLSGCGGPSRPSLPCCIALHSSMSQQRLFSPPTAPGSSFIQHVSSGPGLTRPASVGKQQPSSANITTGGNARPGSTALPQSPRLGTSPGASHPAETSQHLPLTSMLDQSKPKRQTASPQGNSNPAPLRQAHPPPPSAAHSSDPQALTSSVGLDLCCPMVSSIGCL